MNLSGSKDHGFYNGYINLLFFCSNIAVHKFIFPLKEAEPEWVHMFIAEMPIDHADPDGGRIFNR